MMMMMVVVVVVVVVVMMMMMMNINCVELLQEVFCHKFFKPNLK
jgi:hypothetical protein